MRSVSILTACVIGAVVYGIAHDLVTARICVEYFTIGHPKLIESTDPMQVAIAWGVVGTWWVGLLLGIALALTASVGVRPVYPVRALLRRVAVLLAVMAGAALIAGVVGWFLARGSHVALAGSLADAVPSAQHVRFIAVHWAHGASYLIGIAGGVVLVFQVWRTRGLEMIRIQRERRRAVPAA